MSDERARLSKTYRDLDGADLLELYRNRADLSPLAVETLRDELKLRGVDPDSLMATVPKAIGDDEPGDASDASLAGEEDGEEAEQDENAEPPPAPEVPEELRGEFESVQKAPEREAPANPSTMERPRLTAGPAPVEPGTVASATFGLMGLSGIVFAIYVFTGDPSARSFAGIAGVVGAICLGISATLYRNSRS